MMPRPITSADPFLSNINRLPWPSRCDRRGLGPGRGTRGGRRHPFLPPLPCDARCARAASSVGGGQAGRRRCRDWDRRSRDRHRQCHWGTPWARRRAAPSKGEVEGGRWATVARLTYIRWGGTGDVQRAGGGRGEKKNGTPPLRRDDHPDRPAVARHIARGVDGRRVSATVCSAAHGWSQSSRAEPPFVGGSAEPTAGR